MGKFSKYRKLLFRSVLLVLVLVVATCYTSVYAESVVPVAAPEISKFKNVTKIDTLNIKVFCNSSQVYIPNSFSPDGDGLNDIFMVRASGIMQVKSFRIYSRWGELVFEKTNIKPNDPLAGWDGRVKGVIMGPDVYAYTAEVICDNGTPYFMKGTVTLLR